MPSHTFSSFYTSFLKGNFQMSRLQEIKITFYSEITLLRLDGNWADEVVRSLFPRKGQNYRRRYSGRFRYCKLNCSHRWYRLTFPRELFPFARGSIHYIVPVNSLRGYHFGKRSRNDSKEVEVVQKGSRRLCHDLRLSESAGSRVPSRSFDTTRNDSPEERKRTAADGESGRDVE